MTSRSLTATVVAFVVVDVVVVDVAVVVSGASVSLSLNISAGSEGKVVKKSSGAAEAENTKRIVKSDYTFPYYKASRTWTRLGLGIASISG